MKARLYKNIDLVRIPIKTGVTEYAFPTNVDWAGKRIEQLIFCPTYASFASGGGVAYDPMDGQTPVISDLNMAQRDTYLTLVNNKDIEIAHDLHLSGINYQNLYAFLDINDTLNLSLCRIKMTSAPASDGVMLFYAAWDSTENDDYDLPLNSLTCVFPMEAGQEMTFRELINNYVSLLPGRIKGIEARDAYNNPAYLTLRDKTQTYIFRNVHTQLMQPVENTNSPVQRSLPQLPNFFVDELNIDFDWSRIRNAQNKTCEQILTFYF